MAGGSATAVIAAWWLCALAAGSAPAGDRGPAAALRGAAGAAAGAGARGAGGRAQAPGTQFARGSLIERSELPDDWPYLRRCLDPRSPGGLLNLSLPACGAGRSPDFSTGARVAVVGGGPAGTSMAKLLKDRGFAHVTLFEASDRLGGKSRRFEVDGEAHELGTCYVTGKYQCIEAWAEGVGMTEVKVDKERLLALDRGVAGNGSAPAVGSFFDYMAEHGKRHYGIPPEDFFTRFLEARQEYMSHWSATMGENDYMFPSDPGSVDFDALNQTFESWLLGRKLEVLVPFVVFASAGMGYGRADEMPAYYGLTWMHPNYLFEVTIGLFAMFEEGYETLWERLAASSAIDVRLGTAVRRIHRRGDGVDIELVGGGREVFDWLVMASPMPRALTLLSEATEEELELFGAYNYHELTISVFDANGTGALPADYEVFTWADRLASQSDYYRMSLRDGRVEREMYASNGDDGPITIRNDFNIKGLKHDALSILTLSRPNTTDAELTAATDRDVGRYGLQLDLLARKRWDYMPFYSVQEVVRDRKPWRIWDLQGKNRTWWVGSYASFESVADVLDYNLQLLNRRLCQ